MLSFIRRTLVGLFIAAVLVWITACDATPNPTTLMNVQTDAFIVYPAEWGKVVSIGGATGNIVTFTNAAGVTRVVRIGRWNQPFRLLPARHIGTPPTHRSARPSVLASAGLE